MHGAGRAHPTMTTDTDAPETAPAVESTPKRTATAVVPVSVPRDVERDARERARRDDVAIEDALAEHVDVVPAWCFSPAEDGPSGGTRRVALHTAVEPAVADLVDGLATDGREAWVRKAVREQVRRETTGSANRSE